MIILNFSHRLTTAHIARIEELTELKVDRVVEVNSEIDPAQPLQPQIAAMIDIIPLTPAEWETEQLLINLPSLNYSAAVLIAELHGRMGYFPTVLRLRPVPSASLPTFEVAEVLNLQELRDKARQKRLG